MSIKLDRLREYDQVILYSLRFRRYKIFETTFYGLDVYALISVDSPEIEYCFITCSNYDLIKSNLEKYNIKLEKLATHDGNSKDSKYYLSWKLIRKSIYEYRVFFIEEVLNGKTYKHQISVEINSILLPYMEYTITNFKKLKNYIAITSNVWSNNYSREPSKEDKKFLTPYINVNHYINKRVMDIMETYFKCENGVIYCMYNNKKEIAKLTLITEAEKITENGIILPQSLKLEIGNKEFTFYINNHNNIKYKEECEYYFLTMHVYSDSMFNNLIYGYDYIEGKYYYLKNEEKLILKNIDQKIAKKFRNMEKQNLYTYLLSNNKKCGMAIIIDENGDITYKLVKLNDKHFERTLDISLLKPVNEWDEDNNNNYREPDEFDKIDNKFYEYDEYDEYDEYEENENDEEN